MAKTTILNTQTDNLEFEDMRPYYDGEIQMAMKRIANHDFFPSLASYVYPGEPIETVKNKIMAFDSIHAFQHDAMSRMNAQIISRTITAFSCSGIEKLDKNKNYLYVSNHRDIVLDSSLLQYFLINNGFDTTEITFGANLMMNQLVIDIGKSNKMFKVERPGQNAKEFYKSSLHLSRYIRYAITEKSQSVWIAQRNGRTKDGKDKTDQGLIKMFGMSDSGDSVDALAALNIVPVSISYEWESCDELKAIELYQSQSEKYIKKPGEDLVSILTGIVQPKGRVHIEICDPIEPRELELALRSSSRDYHQRVAHLMDSRINANYRLYPNNYIAWDMKNGTAKYGDKYSSGDYRAFQQKLSTLDRYDEYEKDRLREFFLDIYANPVDNR